MTASIAPLPPARPGDFEAEAPLPGTLKSLPARAEGCRLSDLGGLGLGLLAGDLPLPVAVLKEDALSHNAAWMRDFAVRAGAWLAPHGKTTMSPQLFQRQLDAGAWAMTAATAAHVRSYRRFGVRRVLLANQVVGRANLDLLLGELAADAGFECLVLVDSLAALGELQRGLARRPLQRPLHVLLEVGCIGGRTGVRGFDAGVALGRALRDAAPALALRGVECFEGVHGGDDEAAAELAVLAMLDTVAALAGAGCAEHWFAPGEVLLSAGGSAFFDLAAAVLAAVQAPGGGRTLRTVLRSGCTLSHDSLHYARMQSRMRQRAGAPWGAGPGLRPALEVWAAVQSRPEPHRALCTLGKRDVSHDLVLPQPVAWFRPGVHGCVQPADPAWRVTALNDQHAYVDCASGAAPADDWRIGDLVGFGVGHPCTTFDKWPLLFTVDAEYRVLGGVRTYF